MGVKWKRYFAMLASPETSCFVHEHFFRLLFLPSLSVLQFYSRGMSEEELVSGWSISAKQFWWAEQSIALTLFDTMTAACTNTSWLYLDGCRQQKQLTIFPHGSWEMRKMDIWVALAIWSLSGKKYAITSWQCNYLPSAVVIFQFQCEVQAQCPS